MSSNAKKIGLIACTGVVAGNMMGSGIALLPSTLASVGSISIYSWLICIVGALSLAFVFARLATKNPQEGGPIAYAGEVSPVFGFQTGVLYYHANWIGNLAIAITGVSYLSVFFPVLNNPIPAGLATIASVWLFTLVNLLGGSWVSRLCTIGLVLILIPVVGTALFGWTHFDSALYSQNWNVSAGSDGHAVITAVLICLWSFVGVESAAVSSGMVENPKRTVPLATMLGTGLAGLIYVLSTQMISGMFPASEVAASGAPFALATTALFGSWTAPFVSAFTALACFTSLGSWMMLVGEAGKRAANDGNFPKVFGETDRNGVPKKGLLIASSMMTLLMLVLMFFSSETAHASDLFNQLTTDAVLLTMLPYFYSSINLIRFEGMTTRNTFVMLFSGIASLFCMVALAGAEGSTLTATFIMSLIILMFYSKKAGLDKYLETHPQQASAQF
ncbi:TPA: cadaverine/lysine antiporter [Vibrio cholerae]|uniref:Cadaverine/lysine antiporter n=9 Tax=Vibrio TaxID=662 RepID=Q9KV76_VIBCH|nr:MULTISPECIES: cadaverine/lysine antiporter [Vibrio]AEA77559.1 Lysine/cadaverine antiporter membrane protein CadB [Vibrio cholerae LMA3984-4]EYC46762.1 lysine/cadaverine antiporter [Vibrio cholerae O1 biovar El Tor str. L-3226]MDG6207147.1 cadaverine/lysine antiporter [Vibrio sp. NO3-D2]AAF93455.1 cadaverine/lysine antiporter CadB, putative [Vibrio cholerae O1 biovar El Tor str. N16961]ABQ20001.1 putative cadaverine/lysine antiporter CadB [Vibrio cholerae O395]